MTTGTTPAETSVETGRAKAGRAGAASGVHTSAAARLEPRAMASNAIGTRDGRPKERNRLRIPDIYSPPRCTLQTPETSGHIGTIAITDELFSPPLVYPPSMRRAPSPNSPTATEPRS